MINVHFSTKCVFLFLQLVFFTSGQMMTKQHRTHAATTKTVNDLWCYQCNTLDDGDSCTNLTDPNGNYTNFRYKCEDENRICMVKQHTYNYTTNSTKTPVSKLWYIERNCTSKCEPDCIVIGERSKIISCTICCDANFCNNGTSTAHEMPLKWKKEQRILLILAIIFNILFLT
ncbi:uncharacterized protein LOC109852683 isoform X2 [Pseudomyrmex gracilis]|uniref:uncharacterized protein LOC109852683 isoform X2 n=1 Tax=Pseudomyrmex gracilis TaxID=219809 RepID=UPI000994EF70|nr:uncharacterized protein LOC109852683 isoform X2 [Pseudomyrmex gracilis]